MLITIGIIGVVAAMTIPVLNKKILSMQYKTKLEQTYSIITRAMQLAQSEYGDAQEWDISGTNFTMQHAQNFAQYFKPFLKISIDCGVTDKGNCLPNYKYKYLSEYGTNKATSNNYATSNYYYKIVLQNGSTIWWRGGYNSKQRLALFVDVNGKNKPNCWGKDLFSFEYRDVVKNFLPSGDPKGAYPYTEHCTRDSTGWGCAYWILKLNHRIEL